MKIIFPIIFTLIAITGFITISRPLSNDVKNLRAEVSQYNSALTNATELEKTRDSLLETYNKNISEEEKIRLDRFLPNNANNIEFILEIQKLTDLYGLPLKNIKFDPIPTSSQEAKNTQTAIMPTNLEPVLPYGTFNLEIDTEGNYETFMTFLKNLENNLRLVNVKSISFSSPGQLSGQMSMRDPNFYQFNLKIETYWLKN